MVLANIYKTLSGIRQNVHWSELVFLLVLIFSKISGHELFRKIGLPPAPVDIIANLLIFLLVADNAKQISEFLYRDRRGLTAKQTDNLLIGMGNIYILTMAGAIMSAILSLFGLNFGTFFTSLSIVAAAIAVLSKDYVGSIINGMILAFSEEVGVGDYIEIGASKGKVVDMNLTRLVLISDDDEVIYIPNNTAFSGNIINHTKRSQKKTNIEFELDWVYMRSIEEIEKMLIEDIAEFMPMIRPDSMHLQAQEFKHEYLKLKFQYTLKEYDRVVEKNIRRKIQRKLVCLIREIPTIGNG
jgi:MscS family membrane protein